MKFVCDLVYLLLAIIVSPMVVYRMVRHKRYRAGWANRLGKISRKTTKKKCIWIHAVSVGEVNATKTIIKALETGCRDFEIVLSTTTDTGFARASALFADRLSVFYFPLDFSWAMRRAFRNIQPTICLLMELEVWPNFVKIANSSNVPIVVANGRISDKSYGSYKKIRPLAKHIFKKLTLVLAQTDEYAERFIAIGCPEQNVIVTGSLKYDTAQIAETIEGAEQITAQLNIENQRLWVAGGTGNNEEKILLEVYKKLKQLDEFSDLRLAVVPRKPERFDEVAAQIQLAQLPLIRYSQVKAGISPSQIDRNAVILGDTMGDLRKFYSIAGIIFVGRSLVPMGGSDMMEAAALGKCTMFGSHAFNFRQTVDALLAGDGAIMVADADELFQAMHKSLTDSDFAAKIARNGQDVIRKNQGATAKTLRLVADL